MFAPLWLIVGLAAGWLQAGQASGCGARPVRPGGPLVDSRFFDASLERTREALEDAMQAAGVLLIERAPAVVRGERTAPRVSALKAPPGDEAVFGYLETAERDGRPGTLVRVETRRRGGQKGEPSHSWSRAVLDETDCLLSTFASQQGAPGPPANTVSDAGSDPQREVLVPAGTAVTLILRRFLFSGDLRVNQRLSFEVGADVSVGADVVIRRGAPGSARVKAAQDAARSRAANAQVEFEHVSAVSGDRLRVREVVELAGQRSTLKGLAGDLLGLPGWRIALSYGGEYALCAGTRFEVVVDGEQRVRVRRD
jgi:hypothetical protein